MVYVKPEELSDTSAWRTSDSNWVARRAQEWRKIHRKLVAPATSTISAHDLKALRDYFLCGRVEKRPRWEGHDFPSMLLFHRLWLHPDRSEDNWARQLRFTIWDDYSQSLRIYVSTGAYDGVSFDGLNERLYDAMLGGEPVREFLDDDQYFRGKRVWKSKSIVPHYSQPDLLVLSLIRALESDSRDVAFERVYAPRQLKAALEHSPEVVWSSLFASNEMVGRLKALFDLIVARGRDVREMPDPRDEVARDLLCFFDRGIGPRRFGELWRKHRSTPTKGGGPAKADAAVARKAAVARTREAVTKGVGGKRSKAKRVR